MPEATPQTFPYTEEGEEVHRGRVKLGGTSAVLGSPLARGSRVVLIVEADVDTVSHLPFEKLLTRQHHASAAEAYVVDRGEIEGVLAAARRRAQAIADKLEGIQELPFGDADEEPLSGGPRAGGMTRAGDGMDAAERTIRDRGDDDLVEEDLQEGIDDEPAAGEDLADVEDLELDGILDGLGDNRVRGLRSLAKPAGMPGYGRASNLTDESLGYVQSTVMATLVDADLAEIVSVDTDDDGALMAGMTHRITELGSRAFRRLEETGA